MEEQVPTNNVLIIGAGHFGGRAARLLHKNSHKGITVVDIDKERLDHLDSLPVDRVEEDGVCFLAGRFDSLAPETIVVPALPVHLAAEWLKLSLKDVFRITPLPIPDELKAGLPNPWQAREDLLLTSYADFICPEDCEEPEHCTVSGEKRDPPMRDLLKKVKVEGFIHYTVASRQLAPGLGGYRIADLADLRQTVMLAGSGRNWLVGTACQCHGIISAFEVSARDPAGRRTPSSNAVSTLDGIPRNLEA